tara:strand:- start:9095 stop:10027 length:933 start_codon:yes stop_codon:yes gene_type:complete
MKIKKYLPIIGIIIFLYILFKLDLSNILKEISNSNINYLLIAVFFIFIFFITQTLKWFAIAQIQLTKIPFIEALKINIMSMFYGFITPSRIGGIIRSEYLRKYNNNNLGKGLSNYVLDKVLDLGSLAFLAGLFSFMFRDLIFINYFYYALFGFILVAAFLIIFRDKKRSKSVLRIIYIKLVPKKMKEKVKNGFNSFYQDMPKKRYFILFFLLNILNWVVLYTSTFFIGISLGINISFYYFLAILPIAALIGQIPITISGFGTREAVMISLFGLIGISATKVFSMSLISIFFAGVIPALIGSFLIFKNKEK